MKKIKYLVMVLSMLNFQDFQHFTRYILVQQSFPNKLKNLLSNDFDQLMFLQSLSFLSLCRPLVYEFPLDTMRIQSCYKSSDLLGCDPVPFVERMQEILGHLFSFTAYPSGRAV